MIIVKNMQNSGDDMLVSLPSELTCSILASWLEFRDVCVMDSAYCSSTKRPVLLSALQVPTFTLSRQFKPKDTTRYILWALRRNVKLNRIVASGASWSPGQNVYHIAGELASCIGLYTSKFGEHVEQLAFSDAYFLPGSDLTAKTCAALQYCPNLRTFVLNECSADRGSASALLHALSQCELLRELVLTNCLMPLIMSESFDPKTQISSPVQRAPLQIPSLELRCHPELTVLVLKHASAVHLQHLDVTVSSHIVTNHLSKMLPLCSELKSLSLWADTDDNDEFSVLIEACPQIERLELHKNFADDCAYAIAHALPRLKVLDVSNTDFSDLILEQLAERRQNTLESLNVENCANMTGRGLITLLTQCTTLRTLHVNVHDRFHWDPSLIRNLTTLSATFPRKSLVLTSIMVRLSMHGHNLQHLHVKTFLLDKLVIITLIPHFYPNLRTLKITLIAGGEHSFVDSYEVVRKLRTKLPLAKIVVHFEAS